MAKKKKKIVVDGQEVDLSKIKSIRFTLDLQIPKEEFDKLLSSMANIKSDKDEKDSEQNNIKAKSARK